jgi:hypothetical protein
MEKNWMDSKEKSPILIITKDADQTVDLGCAMGS